MYYFRGCYRFERYNLGYYSVVECYKFSIDWLCRFLNRLIYCNWRLNYEMSIDCLYVFND